MTFPIVLNVPAITRSDIDRANDLLRPFVKDLRRSHWRWMERGFIAHLSTAEFMVLAAIVSRTLGWGKIIEVIPLNHFRYGITHPETSQPLIDEFGMPVFTGTGLDKKTLIKALKGLAHLGMITRFIYPTGRRDTLAYMPLTMLSLQGYLASKKNHLEEELPPVFLNATRYDPDDNSAVLTGLEERFLANCIGKPIHDWNDP